MRAFVVTCLYLQPGGGTDPGNGRKYGAYQQQNTHRRRQFQVRGKHYQRTDCNDGNDPADDGKGHTFFVFGIFPDQVHHIFLRFFLVITLGHLLAGKQVVDGDL